MKKSLIFTGYACNESCFFCSAEVNGRKHINKKTKDILNNTILEYKSGSKSIEFMGGEVLVRKDILIIIAFAKKIGFKNISIETNGTLLEDYDFCEKLLKNGLNNITISIHGATEKTNDLHTGLKGSFVSKIKALENFKKLVNNFNFSFSTNYVITSLNINEINDFLVLISNYSYLEKNIFAFVRPIKSYKDNYKNYLPDFKKIKNIFENLKYDEKVLIQYLPYCSISSKFHKKYLDYFAKGLKKDVNKINIEDNSSLEDSIQSEEFYFKECKSCIYKNKCRGIWKEYVDFYKMKKPPLLIPIKND